MRAPLYGRWMKIENAPVPLCSLYYYVAHISDCRLLCDAPKIVVSDDDLAHSTKWLIDFILFFFFLLWTEQRDVHRTYYTVRLNSTNQPSVLIEWFVGSSHLKNRYRSHCIEHERAHHKLQNAMFVSFQFFCAATNKIYLYISSFFIHHRNRNQIQRWMNQWKLINIAVKCYSSQNILWPKRI